MPEPEGTEYGDGGADFRAREPGELEAEREARPGEADVVADRWLRHMGRRPDLSSKEEPDPFDIIFGIVPPPDRQDD